MGMTAQQFEMSTRAVITLPQKIVNGARRFAQRQPLWRNQTYLTLWGAKVVSATGSQMTQIAFPLLVLALTRSAVVAGIAGALRLFPYLVLSLPAGALVDRWDRRRVMIVCETGRALALGSIPLALAFGWLSIAQIMLVAVIEGTFYVFFDVAELAVLPSVVPETQMAAASAQYISLTEGVTTLLGPALGGAIFAAGRAIPFLVDAVSYALSVLALRRVRIAPAETADTSAPLTTRALRDDIMAGVAWLWRNPVLRTLTLFLGIGNVLTGGEALMVIELAGRRGANVAMIGVILAIGGAGTIIGSLFAERIALRYSFNKLFLALNWSVAPVWLLYAIASGLSLGAVMALIGALYTVINVSQFTYRMSLIPTHLQGRISSIIRLVIYGGLPVGMALSGFLLQSVGPVVTALLLGVGLLITAMGMTITPHLRQAEVVGQFESLEGVTA